MIVGCPLVGIAETRWHSRFISLFDFAHVHNLEICGEPWHSGNGADYSTLQIHLQINSTKPHLATSFFLFSIYDSWRENHELVRMLFFRANSSPFFSSIFIFDDQMMNYIRNRHMVISLCLRIRH